MDVSLRFTGRLTAGATRLACQRSENLDTSQAQSVTKRGENIASATLRLHVQLFQNSANALLDLVSDGSDFI
jgi:hypothetical protein